MSNAIELIAQRISKEVGTSSAESYRIATKLEDLAESKGWKLSSAVFKRSGAAHLKAASARARKKPNSAKLYRIAKKLKSRAHSKSWRVSSRGIRKKHNKARAVRRRR